MLTGKNAIITGARSGIGFATLKLFAENGVNCWAVVHRDDSEFIEHINEFMQQHHVWIKPVYIDLANPESIKLGMQEIIHSKLSIDILVNAAGIVSENRLIQMTALDDMHKVMNVNFFAPVQMCQLTSRIMCRQKRGSIINIASIAGINGDLAQLEYAASKAALICASKKMAYEWANYNVRVNTIAPGMIDTKMQKEMNDVLSRERIIRNTLPYKGDVIDIANACLFLADDTSKYITAQTITIDGGGVNFTNTINR